MRRIIVIGLLVAMMVACRPSLRSTTTAPVDSPSLVQSETETLNLTLIQHASCPWAYFWCVVETGIHDAAQDLGVEVTIRRPHTFDPDAVTQLIESAIDGPIRPDAIGVAVIDPDRFRAPLTQAVQKFNIPVIAYNAGSGPKQDNIPYRAYIGPDERQGGYEGGKRLLAESPSAVKGACINHQPGALNLEARCQGFFDALQEAGVAAEQVNITPNPAESEKILQRYVTQKPEVNVFLTLGPEAAVPFYQVISNRKDTYSHGTFDLSRTILTAIEQGTTLFAIDQQPYLEGYLTVQWLTWIQRHGFSPPSEIISTGPSFIDATNVDLMQQQVGEYR
ncbi:sugar ABC transporter substrate-binding protein [Acaryochloris sp. CCMEE 5410]|uniref:sugar ABC transporter substrate-binding protein n=1 Tax=Acaryochloris sp. CCMEE 5410 TaxID=310037 RepID=UPI0002484872|nr:sugar ABC transporter substrate-binding protein [Acaryochloris sp. CCMEE 5410]KAI9133194.1 sugar ABC transporter substrate-binding protein [Acaryochloris sp. CCMEE 5410]